MSGKEEKFWEKFCESLVRLRNSGEMLQQLVHGTVAEQDGQNEIHKLVLAERSARPLLYERMYRAFHGKAESETVRLLVEKAESLIAEADEVALLPLLYEASEDQRMAMLAELVQHALQELERMAGYSSTLEENYMKAEARAQKILNYEIRGTNCYREALRQLIEETMSPASLVWQKEIYERLRHMLVVAADCAVLYREACGISG